MFQTRHNQLRPFQGYSKPPLLPTQSPPYPRDNGRLVEWFIVIGPVTSFAVLSILMIYYPSSCQQIRRFCCLHQFSQHTSPNQPRPNVCSAEEDTVLELLEQ